jgi:hypothetical protein
MYCPIRTEPPWGTNYCTTWIVYHGGIVLLGLLMALSGYLSEQYVWVGIGVLFALGGIVAGLINYVLDQLAERPRPHRS